MMETTKKGTTKLFGWLDLGIDLNAPKPYKPKRYTVHKADGDATVYGVLHPGAVCDNCGKLADQSHCRPYKKAPLYPEVLLCGKCFSQAKRGRTIRIFSVIDARIEDERRAIAERRRVKHLKEKKREADRRYRAKKKAYGT